MSRITVTLCTPTTRICVQTASPINGSNTVSDSGRGRPLRDVPVARRMIMAPTRSGSRAAIHGPNAGHHCIRIEPRRVWIWSRKSTGPWWGRGGMVTYTYT